MVLMSALCKPVTLFSVFRLPLHPLRVLLLLNRNASLKCEAPHCEHPSLLNGLVEYPCV